MFAARGGAAVPEREADGAEPAEEYSSSDVESEGPGSQARVVPGGIRAAVRRRSQEGHTGKRRSYRNGMACMTYFTSIYVPNNPRTFISVSNEKYVATFFLF